MKLIEVLPNEDNLEYQKYLCLISVRDSLPLVASMLVSITLDFALLDCPEEITTIKDFISQCRAELDDEEICDLFLATLGSFEREKKGKYDV